jgi:IrrE N-terminal-like domain
MNSRLQFEIGFEGDPDKGRGASREESASWGWFTLTVDGINLCQYIANSQIADRVHWYLLPFLEWFVENWDSLLHETKLPVSFSEALSARQGFRNFNPYRSNTVEDASTSDMDNEEQETAVFEWAERHSLRTPAGGGIFPDVFFRRARNEIELSWGHTRVQGAPSDLRFLAPAGQTLLDPRETADRLYKTIKQAVDTLAHKLPQSARLSKLSADLAALLAPRTMQRAAWMAGIGASMQASEALLAKLTSELKERYRGLLVPSQENLVISRAPAAVLMFGSLSPTVNEHDVRALLALLEDAADDSNGPSRLPEIELQEPHANPWEQGYMLANLSRKAMGVPETPYRINLDKLLSQSGIEKREVGLSDTKVRAISICGKGLRPLVAVNQSCKQNESEPGLRFTLAHELCHLLFDEEEGVPLAVASGPWADAAIEKRANAFAAMFLMPADACLELLNEYRHNGELDKTVISNIATTFGTGKLATLRHLTNLGLIDDLEADDIEEQLVN